MLSFFSKKNDKQAADTQESVDLQDPKKAKKYFEEKLAAAKKEKGNAETEVGILYIKRLYL